MNPDPITYNVLVRPVQSANAASTIILTTILTTLSPSPRATRPLRQVVPQMYLIYLGDEFMKTIDLLRVVSLVGAERFEVVDRLLERRAGM